MQTTSSYEGAPDWFAMSVLGEVPVTQLGPTACHEHLLIRESLPTVLEPDFRLDDVAAAVHEALTVRAAGGATIVDCMPMGVGRDPTGLVEIATRTSLNVLAVSGFHRDAFYPDDHWVRRFDLDAVVRRVVDDVTLGMEQSADEDLPGARASAQPGLIKVATSGTSATPLEDKLLEAVAEAALTTGMPIITHTASIAGAQHQLDVLAGRGVPADRIILSHMDRHGPANEVADICASGATVCLDRLGRIDRHPDHVVADLVADLMSRGYGHQIVLGQDLARRQYWRAYGGGPGLDHLFVSLVPLLQQAGLDKDDVTRILVDTPRRVLHTVAPARGHVTQED